MKRPSDEEIIQTLKFHRNMLRYLVSRIYGIQFSSTFKISKNVAHSISSNNFKKGHILDDLANGKRPFGNHGPKKITL